MVECWLPYGNTQVYVTIDMRDLLSIAEPVHQAPQESPKTIIVKALAESRGLKLEELISADCIAAIAIEGTTSPINAVAALSPLVEKLVTLIVPKDKITIVIANGTRDRSSIPLIKALKAAEELKGVNLLEHTRVTMDLVKLGETKQKTPLAFNRSYVEATLKIAVGEVAVDAYTGFKGAHTSILPGAASIATIEANRKLILKGDVKPGVIELNQVKEDSFEAVKLAGCDFAIQLVTNLQGKLLAAHTGSLEETWGQAIYSLGSSYQVNAEVGADIVVVSAGGAKNDYDFYTATWALKGALRLVKKGGAVILLAECPEGLGAESFTNLAHIEQQSELERRYALGAEALQILKATIAKSQLYLVSSLPRYMVEPLGITVARTANDAYNKATDGRRSRRTIVIHYGCSTVLVTASN
jgi:nickel-dependent lactate racemase